MKKLMTVVLYLAIVLICSYEVAPKLLHSLEQKPSAVPYAAHSDEREKAAEQIDYRQMLKKSGAHGDMRF